MVPEIKTSSLKLNATIDDIHDRSENEENTASKLSMKNVLYEPGKSYYKCSLSFNKLYVLVTVLL